MGFIEEIRDHPAFNSIDRQLRRRGMVICTDIEGEVHDPHRSGPLQGTSRAELKFFGSFSISVTEYLPKLMSRTIQ